MMTHEEALQSVYRALERLNEELDEPIEITPTTQLFGTDAVIDSLSLVSMIVDVEAEASEAMGMPVSLTDDRAINQEVSPFSSPQTLAAYIVSLQS